MTIKQLSIFVENKAGTVSSIAKSIADAGVSIRALSVADTQEFGILRLIVSDVDKAKDVLSENDCVVSVTKVIGAVSQKSAISAIEFSRSSPARNLFAISLFTRYFVY